MTEYEKLKRLLKRTPILVADGATNEVDLITESEAMKKMASAPVFNSRVMIHAGSALEGFADLQDVGRTDRDFKRAEMSKIAGVPPSTIFLWLRLDLLPPSIRESGSGRGKGPLWS